jgi:hypothetical protein
LVQEFFAGVKQTNIEDRNSINKSMVFTEKSTQQLLGRNTDRFLANEKSQKISSRD